MGVAGLSVACLIVACLGGASACRAPAAPEERASPGASAESARFAATTAAEGVSGEGPAPPLAEGATPGPPRRRFVAESPYPPGAWHQSKSSELGRVVLWPSHLLIRYAGCPEEGSVSFVMADFHSVPAPATRTRDEARALARDLAHRARAEPQRFAELVRQHSEDIVRRDAGGSLGGIPASRLSPWPEVLDALSQLKPDEISDPVETWYGFHIFQRRAPPEPQTVTGRRLVIGHERARWLRTLSGGVAPTRSRDEALSLAQTLYAEARAHPDRFPGLIESHSDLRDRAVGGDFGTWSNREPSAFPREIEVLSELAVGDVALPFDSLFGIQILQRIENRPRSAYALDGLRLDFSPDVPPNDPRSRASVLERARALNQRLLQSPALLPELQRQYRPYQNQWTEGRGSPEVTLALATIAVGELLPEPAHSALHYVIGRRMPARLPPPVAPSFELPSAAP